MYNTNLFCGDANALKQIELKKEWKKYNKLKILMKNLTQFQNSE